MTDRTPRRWLPLAGFTGILALVALLLHSPWLSLAEIEISGAVRSDPATAVAGVGVGEGAFLIWIDTGEVRRSVESDPWVAFARVEREWPDRLRVEVVEREPVALIAAGDTWMLVATDGTVLDLIESPSGGYLQAALAFSRYERGVRPIDPTWDEVVEMALVLRDDIGGAVELELRGVEIWAVAIGVEVRLGAPIDLADKARTMRTMLSTEIPAGAVVDVSSPSRPAIRLPGESQPGVEPSDEET